MYDVDISATVEGGEVRFTLAATNAAGTTVASGSGDTLSEAADNLGSALVMVEPVNPSPLAGD